MPQLQAAKKALRQNARRRAMNDRWRRKLRSAMRHVRDAIAAGDATAASAAYHTAESVLDRVAKRNILHPNKAARRKSRLQAAIAKIKA